MRLAGLSYLADVHPTQESGNPAHPQHEGIVGTQQKALSILFNKMHNNPKVILACERTNPYSAGVAPWRAVEQEFHQAFGNRTVKEVLAIPPEEWTPAMKKFIATFGAESILAQDPTLKKNIRFLENNEGDEGSPATEAGKVMKRANNDQNVAKKNPNFTAYREIDAVHTALALKKEAGAEEVIIKLGAAHAPGVKAEAKHLNLALINLYPEGEQLGGDFDPEVAQLRKQAFASSGADQVRKRDRTATVRLANNFGQEDSYAREEPAYSYGGTSARRDTLKSILAANESALTRPKASTASKVSSSQRKPAYLARGR